MACFVNGGDVGGFPERRCGSPEPARAAGSSPNDKRLCPLFRKNINGVQCQLYQGVEYKRAAACRSCPYRNEATHGGRK